MSSTDERMGKVFRRASRMERRRRRMTTPVMGVLAVFLGVGLMGSIYLFSGLGADITVADLYGSSLMLGSDAGGYVIVAIIAAALAAAITLICSKRSRNNTWYDSADAVEKDERHD
ncbi:MAG: hypothetical protein IJI68_12985 [Eggerthellaceae bacterium]|nr:hypothetical protein [Eggerthellaceae bacterium]